MSHVDQVGEEFIERQCWVALLGNTVLFKPSVTGQAILVI